MVIIVGGEKEEVAAACGHSIEPCKSNLSSPVNWFSLPRIAMGHFIRDRVISGPASSPEVDKRKSKKC